MMDGGIIPTITGAFGDMFNFGVQMENTRYMREMQQKSWEREDNAVQRRAADLKAAGINPLLAAGSAAATSSPIQVGVPQVDLKNAQGMSSMLRQATENRLTQAQKDLADQQYWLFANKGQAEVSIARSNAKAAAENADAARIGKETAQWNLDKWRNWNLPTNAPGSISQVAGGPDAVKGAINGAGNVVKGAWAGMIGAGKKAVESFKEANRLEKREKYEDLVRKGKVSLQGGM